MKQLDHLEFRDALLALMDGAISEDVFERLERTLELNPQMRQYYYDFMLVGACLRNRTGHSAGMLDSSSDVRDATVWYELGEYEKLVEPLDVPVIIDKPQLVKGVRDLKKQLKTNTRSPRLSLYIAISGLAALIMLISYVTMMPRFIPEPVATLTDCYNASWTGGSIKVGDRLTNERSTLTLESGLAKIKFDNNAEVIIEGPSEFCLLNVEQLRLTQGKLTAVVPPMAAGFRVDTPVMSVLDFGTEFGVKVGHDGVGTVSMYEGKASMLAGEAGIRNGSHLLTAGQARMVDSRTWKVEEIAPEKNFVRRLNSQEGFVWKGEPISLASIIAGGNGFNPVFDYRTLNPNTGEYETKLLRSEELPTNYAYNPVKTNPYIDGVFVPNGDQGRIVISSEGHTFDAPATSGIYTHGITAFFKRFDNSQVQAMGPLFDGILHFTETQPSVLMHSNIGMTIDLEKIRQTHPGLRINSLETGYGCSWADRRGFVDFVMLVDGQIKHQHKELKSRSESYLAKIEIEPHSRFLTFIVTDSPRPSQDLKIAHEYDFFYLLNPKLCVE